MKLLPILSRHYLTISRHSYQAYLKPRSGHLSINWRTGAMTSTTKIGELFTLKYYEFRPKGVT
jgi:hypothetical protein